ncbi:MAG: hypothetical protein ACKVX7_04160 [Planctomycetota bacterium]
MPKFSQTRITDTLAAIEKEEKGPEVGGDGTVAHNLSQYLDTMTGQETDTLSRSLSQGDYQYSEATMAIPTGKSLRHPLTNVRKDIEKQYRSYRRALLMVYFAKLQETNHAVGIQRAAAAVSQFAETELVSRLRNELKNPALRRDYYRMRLMAPTWDGWDQTKYRPLMAGCAIGQRGAYGPGTLGCFVVNPQGEIFLLSNYHVLKQVPGGENAIIQPAHEVGGGFFDFVAEYSAGQPDLDAAIARIKPGISVQNRTVGVGAFDITGSAGVHNNMQVQKLGCSTGRRIGVIPDANVINPPPAFPNIGVAQALHQIRVNRDADNDPRGDLDFQIQGDSGTALCDMAGNVVALLNTKHPGGYALATLITPILQRFNVQILGAGIHVSPRLRGQLVNFQTKSLQAAPGGNIKHVLTWKSSTGDPLDLGHLRVREKVSWPTPPPLVIPYIIPPDPEDYTRAGAHYGLGNAAFTPGQMGQGDDTHSAMGPFSHLALNFRGPGSLQVTFEQEYQYSDDNGTTWHLIPNSRYTVRRQITWANDKTTVSIVKTNRDDPGDSCSNSVIV